MINKETQHTGAIALIFSLRMLGLFMILPVLSHYADTLPGASALTLGWALGAYGLTQALLQIPLGLCSDRWGRKPIINLGLGFFLIGSLVAATASTVFMIILGRALQGAGAIGSTLLALLADLTTEKHRTKAMAIVGMTIGFSFILALFLGPTLSHWIGLNGLFWLMCGFALFAMLLLRFGIQTPSKLHAELHPDLKTTLHQSLPLLKNPRLALLNVSIFSLHAILTMLFMIVPQFIATLGYYHQQAALLIYLPSLLGSIILLIPLVILAEKQGQMKRVFTGSLVILGFSILLLWQWNHTLSHLIIALICFFTAFNVLEACLPSWVSKVAPLRSKGTAIGLYSTCQFLGIFVGGVAGGACLNTFGGSGLFYFMLLLIAGWLLLTLFLVAPQATPTFTLPTDNGNKNC